MRILLIVMCLVVFLLNAILVAEYTAEGDWLLVVMYVIVCLLWLALLVFNAYLWGKESD